MYLWRTDQLVQDLKANKVTEREQFKYLLVTTLLYLALLYMYKYASMPRTLLSFLQGDVMIIAGMIIPLFVSYKTNKSGDGRDFIVRYIAIGVPLSIKFFIIQLIALPVFLAPVVIFFPNPVPFLSGLTTVVTVIIVMLYIWRMFTHFKCVSR